MPSLLPWPAWILTAVLIAAPLAGAAAPQSPQRTVESQRITAFDLLFELTRKDRPEKSVAAPADLAIDDLTLLWDGRELPLVGLATGDADPEPWRLVIYFDRQLSSNHTIRWAAMELAERARRLVELGEVEIVVAEPEPRRVLAPSRDAQLVDESLSGVFLAPAGVAELVARREQFLVDHPGGALDPSASMTAVRAAAGERFLVREQADRLLGWLVESEPPTSRRAVLLVGDGWDLSPESFYAGGVAPPWAPDLDRDSRELAETLAAFGWICAPLAPPRPPVGAGRFGAFVLADATFPWLFAVKLRSLEVWLDGNRKPKKADALTELGGSLRRQGRFEEAVTAYRQAVYHYYDHPKTAQRQAVALVGLGETLELLERQREARAAFRTATAFDPALAKRYPFAAAALQAPLAPLERLAGLTAGSLATDTDALDRLLSSLGHRVRLTAQLAGEPDGELHRLEVRLDRPGFDHRSAAVARWGTPPAILRLRLRGLLESEPTSGELEFGAEPLLDEPESGSRLVVELQLPDPPPAAAGPAHEYLVSWASGGPSMPIRYGLRAAAASADPTDGTTARVTIDPIAGHSWLAFLIERPADGAWGGIGPDLPFD